MSDLDAFRAELRDFLETACPASMRTPVDLTQTGNWGGRKREFYEPVEDGERWMKAMAGRGLTAPTWPREYGGAGLDRAEHAVLVEEMARIGARPPLSSIGLIMLGPLLLELGSEAQKREHLPAIANGDIRWCQGYSEPGAGSDLAAVQTRAEDRGDHYVVTGQKIWTSYADRSDMIFCLVRTDPDAPKHKGISFLLVDMDQPEVRTRPIRLISGASPFCETFFDGARAEKRNLVGAPGAGWTIGKRLLQFERQSIGGLDGAARGGRRATPLPDLARRYCGERGGRIADPVLRDRVAALEMRAHAQRTTMRRVADEARAGTGVGTASSIFKYLATEGNKRRYELLLEILGARGIGWEGPGFTADELATTRQWLRSKANSIEGGTSEIQLDIIARRVLGLPR